MTTPLTHLARLSLATLLLAPCFGHAEPADTRPAVLRALDGSWTMSGDVMGKPVTYRMTATPALQGTFTDMRMQDVQVPAQYEAVVFIGYDAASENIIVLESKGTGDTWKHFARYQVKRN